MAPKRWLLLFTFVGVLALAILYIKNNRSERPRPGPQQIPSPTPEVVQPRASEASIPARPPKPALPAQAARTTQGQVKINIPILASNALVRTVRPQYTQAAWNAHYEGEVKVNLVVGTDGTAHNIEIVNSPGYGLDQVIIDAVK